MSAEEACGAMPLAIVSANIAIVRKAAKTYRGDLERWAFVGCPSTSDVMDETVSVADMVTIPTTLLFSDVVKSYSTASVLESSGINCAVLITPATPRTISLVQTMEGFENNVIAHFEYTIPGSEGIKLIFGSAFDAGLYRYDATYAGSKKAERLVEYPIFLNKATSKQR